MTLTFHKKKFPSQDLDKFVIRLPPGLRDRIGATARSNNRSMNAEIVSGLEQLFPEQGRAGAVGGAVVKADSATTDILIELQHQLGHVAKMIEELPKCLAPISASNTNKAVPSRKKKI